MLLIIKIIYYETTNNFNSIPLVGYKVVENPVCVFWVRQWKGVWIFGSQQSRSKSVWAWDEGLLGEIVVFYKYRHTWFDFLFWVIFIFYCFTIHFQFLLCFVYNFQDDEVVNGHVNIVGGGTSEFLVMGNQKQTV